MVRRTAGHEDKGCNHRGQAINTPNPTQRQPRPSPKHCTVLCKNMALGGEQLLSVCIKSPTPSIKMRPYSKSPGDFSEGHGAVKNTALIKNVQLSHVHDRSTAH